jgi:TetR/AcrR family transcriptional repressor of cmeABC operon
VSSVAQGGEIGYSEDMARLKDEQKRESIQQTAKMLFAQAGFFNTSISDIVRESGFSVGTIYTYFKSKDEIVRSIVDEGWEVFRTRLQSSLEEAASPQEALAVVLDRFLPELLDDLDLINIILTEALQYTRLEAKIHELRELIGTLLGKADVAGQLSREQLEAAMMVYFLGVLDSARIATSTKIDVTVKDVVAFVRHTVEEALGVDLPKTSGAGS